MSRKEIRQSDQGFPLCQVWVPRTDSEIDFNHRKVAFYAPASALKTEPYILLDNHSPQEAETTEPGSFNQRHRKENQRREM